MFPRESNVPILPAARSVPRWWAIVGMLMLVVATGHFNRIAISVAGAERIIPRDGISEERMGQIYSAFLLLYTLAMTPTAWLVDRFGPRRGLMVFCFGSLFFVAATGVVGLCFQTAFSLWIGLLAVRFLMGAVNAPLHPAAARMVFAHVPGRSKSFANGLVTFGACAGISATYYGFGGLISAFAPAGRWDWPLAFLSSSAITLVVAVIWTWGTRNLAEPPVVQPTTTEPPPASSPLAHLLNRGVICVTLSYAALGYFQYLFFYWIQYFFKDVENFDAETSRLYSTAITLVMGLGMVFGGWLADRLSGTATRSRRRLVPGVGLFAAGVVFIPGLLTSDSRVMVGSFTVTALLIGLCEGAFWTTIVELGGPHGATAAGVMNTGGNAGGLISPVATPFLSVHFAEMFGRTAGWRMSLAVASVISMIGGLMWLGVRAEPPAETPNSD